jgi:lipoic acid synthetase
LERLLAACPDVLGHNLETVPRLYATARAGADYRRSLALLAASRQLAPGIPAKSGLMLGLGEERAELLAVFADLRSAGVGMLTLGQYLQPTRAHLPVARYLPPEKFAELRTIALAMGFAQVAAGPLVRSSYHAAELYEEPLHARS